MTDEHVQAVLAAIEKKLIEADKRIIEARKIFQHYVYQLSRPQPTPEGGGARRSGLYPGQKDNHVDEEDLTTTPVEECLE